MEVHSQAVDVDGCRLVVDTSGQGSPVLFLHGAASTGTAWSLNVGVLSTHYRCVVPDLPACGRSSRPEAFWSLARQAANLRDMAARLGIQRAHWVGNSLGALLAAEVASRWPAAVDKLVLVAPPPLDEALRAQTLLQLLRLVGEDGVPRFASVEQARLITPHASEPLLELANANFAAGRWFYESLAAVAGYRATVDAIESPTWLVWGAADGLVPPAAWPAWRAALRSPVTETVFEGSGHCPQFDEPRLFNTRLRQFLAQLPRLGLL